MSYENDDDDDDNSNRLTGRKRKRSRARTPDFECAVIDCDDDIYVIKAMLCSKHYRQLKNMELKNKECKKRNCYRQVTRLRMCRSHYDKHRKRKSLVTQKQKQVKIDDKSPLCTYDIKCKGISFRNTEMCRSHFDEYNKLKYKSDYYNNNSGYLKKLESIHETTKNNKCIRMVTAAEDHIIIQNKRKKRKLKKVQKQKRKQKEQKQEEYNNKNMTTSPSTSISTFMMITTKNHIAPSPPLVSVII